MGGKKGKGKKGKKGGKKQNTFNDNMEEGDKYASLQVEFRSLQSRLSNSQSVMEAEFANKERAAENELRQKVEILSYDLEEEKKRTWDVTCDMTRQYKSMQQEKDERIRVLQESIAEHEQAIEKRNTQLEEVLKEKQGRIQEKDEEIRNLTRKIDEMSQRFAGMLKDTLDQMKEKIEMVNKNWDEDMDMPALKKIEDLPIPTAQG